MAQTATQWLRKEISKLGTRSRFYHDVMELIDEAEKKGEEQIKEAFNQGENNSVDYFNPENRIKESEQYYNETYKTQAQ